MKTKWLLLLTAMVVIAMATAPAMADLPAGVTLNFDASDPASGVDSSNWNSLTADSSQDWDFGLDVTLEAVTTLHKLTKAYHFTGGDADNSQGHWAGYNENDDASWEFWLKPIDTGILDPEQTLLESGGGGDGISFWYQPGTTDDNQGTVNFTIDDGGVQSTVSAVIDTTEFCQITGVFDMDTAGGDIDLMQIYVNGVLIDDNVSATTFDDASNDSDPTGIADWSGTNGAGLGNDNGNVAETAGQGQYDGYISVLRFWEEKALTAAEVAENFLVLGVVGATDPSPEDGALVYPTSTLELSWTNMDPNSPGGSVYVDVWLSMDPVTNPQDGTKVVDAEPDATSVTVDASDKGTYYWQVNSYRYGSPTGDPCEGSIWTFIVTSDFPPSSVDAGVDMITWSGEPVPLDATVVDDGASPLTYAWTANPSDGVVFDPNASVEDPTVTITKPIWSEVTVPNAGFEDKKLNDGSFVWFYTSEGTWCFADPYDVAYNPDPPDGHGAFGQLFPWNPSATDLGGNWDNPGFGGEVPEGQNCVVVGSFVRDPSQAGTPDDYTVDSGLAQLLETTYDPARSYKLSVKYGSSDSFLPWAGYKVELLAGGTNVRSSDQYTDKVVGGTVLGVDTSADPVVPETWYTSTVTVPANPANAELAGEPLQIRLSALKFDEPNRTYAIFDDVKLDVDDPPVVHTVTLTLSVHDESLDPTPLEDTMTIDVYEDACQLARLALGLSAITDFDDNCITELSDLGVFIEAWLDNYAATGPLPAGGDPEDPVQTEPINVPNGDFDTLYKPGSTTITASLDSGEYFQPNATNQGVNCALQQGGIADYSDGTTGSAVDFPSWTFLEGGSDVMMGGSWGGPDGSVAMSVFTGWGGTTQVTSAQPLNVSVGGGSFTLSADVYHNGRPVYLDLTLDGVIVPPTTAIDPPGVNNQWVVFTRTYDSIPAGELKILFGTIDSPDETGNRASIDNVTLEWVNPMNPSPANGGFAKIGAVDLSWTNLDPNYPGHSVYVDVWFGTEPNELHPGYDMTKVVTAGENTTTWTVSAPTEGTYYWQVNSYLYGPDHIDEPNALVGSLWSFQAVADVPPTVEIDTLYQMTWSGEPVPLASTVTDDGTSALTLAWTADAPVGVNVGFDPGTAAEDPTVTITKLPYSEAMIANAGFEAVLIDPPDEWGPEPATGWGVIGRNGTWNPPADAYSKIYSSGTNVPEGQMCGWVQKEAALTQVLNETLAADTQYELTVQVGNSMRYDWCGYNVQFLAGGTVLAEDPNVNVVVPYDDWALVTVPFDSTGVDPSLIGQPLEIRLINLGQAADYAEINFDDVKLTADPPFPAPTWMQTVTLTVAVSDEGNPTPDTDTIEIDVYVDACQMARMGLGLSAITDFDENCITDLRDYAVIAATWLVDYELTAPVAKP